MKNNWFLNIFLLLFFCMGAESSFAQGLLVSKKDGTQIRIPYEQLDYVTVFDAQEPNPGEISWPKNLGKKLVEINEKELTYYDGDPLNYTANNKFVYDDKGRLTTVTTAESEDDVESWTSTSSYQWDEQNLTIKGLRDEIYKVADGKIVHSEDGRSIFDNTYDDKGQLVEYTDKYYDYETFKGSLIWQDGKPVKYEQHYVESPAIYKSYQFEYSGKTCKGYFPFMLEYFTMGGSIVTAHPDLVGNIMNNLPSKITYKDNYNSEGTMTFSYVFDKDGYLTKCTIKEIYISKDPESVSEKTESTTTYTYTWK